MGLYLTPHPRCRACVLDKHRAYRAGSSKGTLPAEPLLRLIERRPIREYDENFQRRYYRIRASGGISITTADEVSCSLGVHPTEIWGNDFYREDDPDG
jgi:hypothetical protein